MPSTVGYLLLFFPSSVKIWLNSSVIDDDCHYLYIILWKRALLTKLYFHNYVHDFMTTPRSQKAADLI